MKRNVVLIVVAAALMAATAFAAPPAARLAGTMEVAHSRFAADEPVA